MNNNKVEFIAPAGTAQVHPAITIFITISIGNRALVLHTQVRRFNQLVSILIKRVGPEPMLKGSKHHRRLFELYPGFFKVLLQYIVVAVEITLLAFEYLRKMSIVCYIYINAVIIYRVCDKPVIGRCFILLFYNAS